MTNLKYTVEEYCYATKKKETLPNTQKGDQYFKLTVKIFISYRTID